jgi:hypothetical protein
LKWAFRGIIQFGDFKRDLKLNKNLQQKMITCPDGGIPQRHHQQRGGRTKSKMPENILYSGGSGKWKAKN